MPETYKVRYLLRSQNGTLTRTVVEKIRAENTEDALKKAEALAHKRSSIKPTEDSVPYQTWTWTVKALEQNGE